MKARVNLSTLTRASTERAVQLQQAINENTLDKKLLELVKIRVSQLNGCAYCLHLHVADALKLGETQPRLFVVAAWHESTLFSAAERAALAWAEQLTRVSQDGAPDALFDALKAHFSEIEIAALTDEIAMINFWNRRAIGLGYVHPSESAAHS